MRSPTDKGPRPPRGAGARAGTASRIDPGKRTRTEAGPHDRPRPPTATSVLVQRTADEVTAASPATSAPDRAGDTRGIAPSDPAASLHAAAARGIGGGAHALPHLDRIQRLFGGHDLSGIKAHTDESAAAGARAMGAQAFATRDHVAFAATPDLHTTAHEAAHVVQQRSGVALTGGVDQRGDAHERNADAVADRVVQGQSAADLLPAPGEIGGTPAQGGVQRQGDGTITPQQLQGALTWVTTSRIGVEAVKEVQRVCGIEQTGVYDETTVRAVFAKQREIGIATDGKADAQFCHRTGIIFTHTITPAEVSDPLLRDVATRFPDGITVAIYPNYDQKKAPDKGEFALQADQFAKNHQAVGLSAGAVALGVSCPILTLGDVLETVQSIHRGLAQKWAASNPGQDASAAPAFTRVHNLALFTHGESYGVGLNSERDFYGEGLHNNTTPEYEGGPPVNPPDVEAFVRGLSGAVLPDVRVLLYGCSAGRGKGVGEESERSQFSEWGLQAQGDRAGVGSLAESLAQGLGPAASVLTHTTDGHVTSNYAARVFGAESGGPGGIPIFDVMYPEAFVQTELARLFPGLGAEALAARHDSLRTQMFEHFKDSVWGAGKARYTKVIDAADPIGQEMFIDPDNARALLHADWITWIPKHLAQVTPSRTSGPP